MPRKVFTVLRVGILYFRFNYKQGIAKHLGFVTRKGCVGKVKGSEGD